VYGRFVHAWTGGGSHTNATEETPPRLVPAHGVLQRPGAKPALRITELPPWHGWRYDSDAERAVSWIESLLVLPTGHGAGSHVKVAPFQRKIVEALYDSLALFVSIAAANGKTTLLSALALERICRGDDYAEVDVVATKQDQAAILVETAKRMVECCPDLVDLVAYHSKEGVLEYRPTGSILAAHPAKLSAIQGLNFSLAIVDEVGFAHDEIVESLLARLAKRPDARVVGIGTPGFEPNMLQRLRAAHHDGELPSGVRYLEWAAPAGCDLLDPEAWRKANPALGAGFLSEGALEVQANLLPERAFRTYHLGQWVDTTAGWLPPGAWESCPLGNVPPDGSEIVVAVEGTFRRSLAVVGAGLDGTVFLGWAAEIATDDDLRHVIEELAERWSVVEITHPRRIRPGLFAELALDHNVRAWTSSADTDAASANEFYRAIVEGRVVHDHDPLVAEQMGGLRVRWGVDGSLRLARPDDGTWVDAAMAARAAWWRAAELVEGGPVAAPVIY
jgi:phage terminase large subunit-like protein